MGVEIFPGFAASKIIYDDQNDNITGVQTGDMGIDKDLNHKDSFEPGLNILAKVTVLSEGCRGHLGKEVINKFKLNKLINHPNNMVLVLKRFGKFQKINTMKDWLRIQLVGLWIAQHMEVVFVTMQKKNKFLLDM